MHESESTQVTVDELQRELVQLRSERRELQSSLERRADELETLRDRLKQEVDERERVAAALWESEERARLIGESLDYGIWIADKEGRCEYVSDAFLRLVGKSMDELRDFGWTDRLPQEERNLTIDRWLYAVESGSQWDCEHRVLSKDGKYFTILSRGRPFRDDDGNIVGWVGINLDITKRKKYEEALRETVRQKDQFLAMLGHELRNPLAAIRNAVQLQRMIGTDNERLARSFEIIERQSAHMSRLVADLLDVSRIARGMIRVSKEPVELAEVVRTVVDDHRARAEKRGLHLRAEIPSTPIWVRGDPVRLAQIIANLVDNALKFTDRGGRVTVDLSDLDSEHAIIRVQDTGQGLDPESLPRVFDPFQQGRTTLDRSSGGLGLGLALVRGLVTLHGGTVKADSAGSQQGATFTVTLPQIISVADESEVRQAPRRSEPRRILVIEDNRDAAESLRILLELAGHEVCVAQDGRGGLEAGRQFRPDVVLCDIGLPGAMSGYGVARAFRRDARTADACLIAVTGYGLPEDRRLALEAGFDSHLTKPVDLECIEQAIARHSVSARKPLNAVV